MEPIELLDLISKGENSKIQFKERVLDAYSIATEMVAFSNSAGGLIVVGVNDKTGTLNGLTFQELQVTNQLLSNAASDNVKRPITIFTETVSVSGNNLVVVQINEGRDKPYRDNKGIIWIKNGSDKRKVVSNDELLRLLQSSGNIAADEQAVENTTLNDIDTDFFKKFVERKTGKKLDELGQPLPKILSNMGFASGDQLTLAGLLLFGKRPQAFKPMFTVQCVAFVGNDLSGTEFRDKAEPMEGNLDLLFEKSMSFIIRNLRKIQAGGSFNTIGELEIPRGSIEELVVNALIHRDYFIRADVKIFIFDNRIEIISPGKLPNTQTIDKIKAGTSIVRNSILFSNARYVLPYVGIGSGIPRALSFYSDIEFINDTDRELFKVMIQRPQPV
ncbi:MAG TPA: RNA-binding domain-containing protein [Candidatus Kryptonia bacterium]